MKRNYFSLEEAQKIVRTLTPIIQRLHYLHHEIQKANYLINNLQQIKYEDYDEQLSHEAQINKAKSHKHNLSAEYYTLLSGLHERGCILKDIHQGLIDFYHELNGRTVFLCWKQGEQTIQYYHDCHEGFAQRKRILTNEDF